MFFKGCLVTEVMSVHGFVRVKFDSGSCVSTDVTASYMWNLKKSRNKGTWMQLPEHANAFFGVNDSQKLANNSGFTSTENLMGQLVKLNLSCGKCLVFPINGSIIYPFELETHFPELYPGNSTTTKSTDTPSTTTDSTDTTNNAVNPTSQHSSSTALSTKVSVLTSTASSLLPSATTMTTTFTIRNTENYKNKQNKQKTGDVVSAAVITALVVISTVVVLLVIIIVCMCRRRGRNATLKGPIGNEAGAIDATKKEDIYLTPVDTLHNNQFTYQDSGALADNNALFNPEIGNPGYERKIYSAEPTGNPEENNTYSYIGENRSKEDSVLSNNSATGLIGNDYSDQQTGHSYSVLEAEIVINPAPGGLNPIEENYEVVSRSPSSDTRPSHALDLTEPVYAEASGQENYTPIDINTSCKSQLPYENYEKLDTRTRTTEGDLIDDSSKNNSDNNGNLTDVEFTPNNVEAANPDPVSSSNNGMLNPNYESNNTNYYHMLEVEE